MTLFATVLSRLGLSQTEAAAFLKVRPDTIKSWGAGRNPVPDGIWADLQRLAEKQQAAADAILAAMENSENTETIEFALPPDAEIARRGWPSRRAFITVLARAWEKMPPTVRIRIVPSGSTESVQAAERARKFSEP